MERHIQGHGDSGRGGTNAGSPDSQARCVFSLRFLLAIKNVFLSMLISS